MDTGKEITQSLVINHSFLHGFTNRLVDRGGLSLLLDSAREELEGNSVGDFFEARVFLFVGVDIVLDFGHEEFTDTEETRARRNLIAEGLPNGSRGERHAQVVKFEKFRECEKLALCSFGAKIPRQVAAGANGG